MWTTDWGVDKKLVSTGKKVEKFKAKTALTKSGLDLSPPRNMEKAKQHSLLTLRAPHTEPGTTFLFPSIPTPRGAPGLLSAGAEPFQSGPDLSPQEGGKLPDFRKEKWL